MVPALASNRNLVEGCSTQEIRLLLEQMRGVLAQQKAILEQQDAINKEFNKRLGHLEHCPCPVRHDPAKECPIYIIEKKFARYLGIYAGVTGVVSAIVITLSLLINLYK
jgi:hypothetical protein